MGDAYIFRHMHRIRGYLDPGDALILDAFLRHQAARGYRGGAAEIGIYFGRSYYLIAGHLRPEERCLAIDLFDAPPWRGQSQRQAFEAAGRAAGLPVPAEAVIESDSGALCPADILTRAGGPVRLFSIDGGHGLGHVAKDARLAAACLSAEGVIVFDDFCNPEWPEVTAAVLDFLRAEWATLRPVAVSQKKLYVCRRERAAEYATALQAAPGLAGLPRAPVGFLGQPVLHVRHRLWQRIGYELLCRLGLAPLSAALYRGAPPRRDDGSPLAPASL